VGARRLLHARQRGQQPARTTGLLTFGGNGYTDTINECEAEVLVGLCRGHLRSVESTNLTAGLSATPAMTATLVAQAISYNGAINDRTP
jgi:iron complex outermembrane receptor protein